MSVRGSENDVGEDVLAGGSDRPKVAERLPERWRRTMVVAVALLIGLVVGGYAGYSWPDPQAEIDRQRVQLSARVGELDGLNLQYPPYRLTLELRNTGPLPVTVEETRLDLPGFDTFATDGGARELASGEQLVLHYGVYPKCGDGRPGSEIVSVDIRVRPASDEVRTVTVPAVNTEPGLRAGHAMVCALPPATLGAHARTLDTSVRPDGSLRSRLRLRTDPSGSANMPDGLRLLDVGARVAGLEVQSQLPGPGTWAMPVAVGLHLRVDECDTALDSLDEPVALRVAFVSDAGPRLVYAAADTAFNRALRRYVRDRCGAAG